MNAAEMAAGRAAYIVELVDNSPPLTPSQTARLQALFAVPKAPKAKRRNTP